MNVKKMLIWVGAIFLVIILLGMFGKYKCGDGICQSWEERRGSCIIDCASYDDNLSKKYENLEYKFSINYPEDYILEQPKSWQDPTEVFRARSFERIPLLTASVYYMEDGSPYEEVLRTFEEVIRTSGITDVNVGKKKDILLSDGTTVWQTEISYKSRGYKLKSLNLWVQKYNRWFAIALITTEAKYNQDAGEMQAIIDSFTAPTRGSGDDREYVTFKEEVEMSDGKYLNAHVVLPDTTKPYPIIFWYSTYGTGYCKPIVMMAGEDDELFGPDARANYGYVFVSIRGRYESQDAWYRGAPTMGEDGADLVEWIDKQSWSGKIGLWGWGADGAAIYETAAENPEGLTAIVPQVAPWLTEDYTRFYPGGVLREANMVYMSDQWPGQWDEIIAHPTNDDYWIDKFIDRPNPEEIKVPVSVDSGWYSHNVNHLLSTYDELKERSSEGINTKTIIGPWSQNFPGVLQQGDLEYPLASKEDRRHDGRFFDYWLRDVDNGFYEEGPIYYYQMGEDAWKNTLTWPPLETNNTNYYLQGDSKLLLSAPKDQIDPNQYTFDPENPSPSIGGPLIWPTSFHPDPVIGPAYQDNKVLFGRDDYQIYETSILAEDLEIAGNPSVNLYVESNTPDTDIIVRLIDYDPSALNGKQSLLVGIAPQRMRYREGLDKQVWMEPGEVYEVNVKMDPVAYTWKKGHQLKMVVSSSAYPLYSINPNNKEHFMWDDGEPLVANLKLWSNKDYPSHLILPVQD